MGEVIKEKKKGKGLWAKIKGIKNIELIAAGVIAAVIILIYLSTLIDFKPAAAGDSADDGKISADYCERVRAELERTLSQIKGAGKVSVAIRFSGSVESVIAYVTSENVSSNADGGRTTDNKQSTSTPQIISSGGAQKPVVLKEIYPKAAAVIVLAQGADDAKIKVNIIQSVSIFLDIGADKITVLPMRA